MLSFFKHLVRYWWVWAALIALLGTAWLLRSEEYTSELQSRSAGHLVCRLLLEIGRAHV